MSLNSIMNTGLKGMMHSQAEIQKSAEQIVRAALGTERNLISSVNIFTTSLALSTTCNLV